MTNLKPANRLLLVATLACLLPLATFANTTTKHKHNKRAAAQPTVASNLTATQAINSIIAHAPSNVDVGVFVKDLNTGQIVYAKNSDRNFVPASTLKVFTAIAALSYLGPHYRYQTMMATDTNNLQNGVLPGNLYVQFTGDPTLSSTDLANMVQQLKRAGIDRINGHVYIDGNALGKPGFGPGWAWDDTTICYSAPVSAVVINHNCFGVQVVPGKNLDSPTMVQGLSNFPFAQITNTAITRSGYSANCPLTLTGSPDNHYYLDGCLPLKAGPQYLSIAVQNPPQAAVTQISAMLARQGITVGRSVEIGHTNATLYRIASHSSDPLVLLIKHMLKVSDNIYANTLFKTLGHAYANAPASWYNSSLAMKQILINTAGVNLNHAKIVDGSGLSRYNLVTPSQLVSALDYAFHKFPADYQNLLPISGIDGTLKYRMGTKNTIGRIHAKTGTLQDMTNLAGYIKAANGHTLAFAILVNNTPKPVHAYQIVANNICTYLATSGDV